MFCEQCGAPIPEGAKFCENCGAPVPVMETAPKPEPSPEPEPKPAQPKRLSPARLVIGAVILVLIALAAWWVWQM